MQVPRQYQDKDFHEGQYHLRSRQSDYDTSNDIDGGCSSASNDNSITHGVDGSEDSHDIGNNGSHSH
eukprot:9864600-Karenia_brevis.AAC.1